MRSNDLILSILAESRKSIDHAGEAVFDGNKEAAYNHLSDVAKMIDTARHILQLPPTMELQEVSHVKI